jgi:hypothetical protein
MTPSEYAEMHRIKFKARWSGNPRWGECEVRYIVDGERKNELFFRPQEAAEFCVGIGLDHFFAFMPDNKWHRIMVEQKEAAE